MTFAGNVVDHESRTDSVHLYYDLPSTYDAAKVRVTPETGPVATYYSALNWYDSYAGIQFDGNTTKVLFSVWDANNGKARIEDQGACNATVDFDGEGTGTSCRLMLPPSEYGAIPGLPDDYMLQPGDTYELALVIADAGGGRTQQTLTFEDVTRGYGPISLGTQSTVRTFAGGGWLSSFVEEWVPHGSCLSATRAVFYHDIQYRTAGEWHGVESAQFSPNYIPSNNEICGNYLATVVDGKFFVSSGGSEYVGRPYIPNDLAFPKPRQLALF